MKINWGKELLRVADEQEHDSGMLAYIQNEMKRNVSSNGNPFDDRCAWLFKCFVVTTIWWQYQRSGDVKTRVNLYENPEQYLDFEKVKSEAITRYEASNQG